MVVFPSSLRSPPARSKANAYRLAAAFARALAAHFLWFGFVSAAFVEGISTFGKVVIGPETLITQASRPAACSFTNAAACFSVIRPAVLPGSWTTGRPA